MNLPHRQSNLKGAGVQGSFWWVDTAEFPHLPTPTPEKPESNYKIVFI